MKNQTLFMKLVKGNRKELLADGYKPARLTMWAQGKRNPPYSEAENLAKLLCVSVDQIPWVRWQKND